MFMFIHELPLLAPLHPVGSGGTGGAAAPAAAPGEASAAGEGPEFFSMTIPAPLEIFS